MTKKDKKASESWVKKQFRIHAAKGRAQVTKAIKKQLKPRKRRVAKKRRRKKRR